MLHFTRWKQIAIVLSCLLGIVFVVAQLLLQGDGGELALRGCPRTQLNLGLDLRGGAHLLLSMETEDVRKDWLDTLRDDARKRLRDAKIAVTGLGIANNAVQVRLAKPEDADAALKELRGMVQPIGSPLIGTGRQRHRRAEGRGRRDHHHADRGRPAAPHQQRHRRRHRDRAPPRRCAGHHGGADRPPGQRPHPGAGAGPAGYGRAEEADRQDGAPDLPRGAPDDVGRGGEADARAGRASRSTQGADSRGGRAAAARDAGGARRRAGRCAAGLRPADQRADHLLPLQQLRRAQVRRRSPRTTSAGRSPSCSTTR